MVAKLGGVEVEVRDAAETAVATVEAEETAAAVPKVAVG